MKKRQIARPVKLTYAQCDTLISLLSGTIGSTHDRALSRMLTNVRLKLVNAINPFVITTRKKRTHERT